jgi:AraC family transcriptional regulator, arabinose operon regulatory protein
MTRLETATPRVPRLLTGLFDQGRGYGIWRSHGTGDWLLTCTLGGLGRYGHALGEIQCAPGQLVLLRPGAPHDYGVETSRQRWRFLWVHFHPRPEWLEWMSWPEEAPGLMRLDASASPLRARIERRFGEVHHLATGAEPKREELAMNALEETLLWCERLNPARTSAVDERVRAAMEHCCRNLSERISLASLAKAVGLSPSRLSFLFQRQTGVAPMRYLEHQRLSRARDLLEATAVPVQEIAEQVGFASPFYFSLRFRRFAGVAPRAYRRTRGR